jgi:hypothetical protein
VTRCEQAAAKTRVGDTSREFSRSDPSTHPAGSFYKAPVPDGVCFSLRPIAEELRVVAMAGLRRSLEPIVARPIIQAAASS